MSESVLYMSMSVDGYIAAPNVAPGNPGGDEFMRLRPSLIQAPDIVGDDSSSRAPGFVSRISDCDAAPECVSAYARRSSICPHTPRSAGVCRTVAFRR